MKTFWLLVLVRAIKALVLSVAILLLTGCVSPCRPSITPSADRMTPTLISRLLDSGIGIDCEWRY